MKNFAQDVKDEPLPDNKTCSDCVWFSRCQWLFQCRTYATKCDFYPSRFRPANEIDAALAKEPK